MTVFLFAILFFLLFSLTPKNWRNGLFLWSVALSTSAGFCLTFYGLGTVLILAGVVSCLYFVILLFSLNGAVAVERSSLLG